MLNIVTVCGAGVGSSMMMRLYAQQSLSEEGIEASVEAADIGSVNPDAFDVVITTSDFADLMNASRAKIVRIDNMMDKAYLKEQLLKTIKEL